MGIGVVTAPLRRRSFVGHQIDALVICVLILGLSLHAAWRGLRSDYDAEGYSIWFDRIRSLSSSEFQSFLADSGIYFNSDLLFGFESGFAIFTFFITRLSSSIEAFFFVCAALSLSMKGIAVIRFCSRPLPAFLWYVSWSYILLEMTTMRAGIASGILMLGYGFLRDKRTFAFLSIVAVATTFHASAAAAVLLLVATNALRARHLLLMLAASIALSFVSIVPIIDWLGSFNEKAAEYYRLYTDLGLYDEINRFNVVVILRILFLLLSIYLVKNNKRDLENPLRDATLFALPIIIYFAFSSFPIIGGRLYELLGVFQVFLISAIFATPRLMPRLIATGIMAAQFFILVFHVRFVDFFYFIGTPYNLESIHRL